MNMMTREGAAQSLRDRLSEFPVSKLLARRVLMLGGVLLVALGALYFYFSGGRYVTTDDSYIRAAKLMVSSDVSGTVSDVAVHEGQLVKKGDVLFRLDAKPFQIALDSAKSDLAQTALSIDSMKHDYQRMLSDIAAQNASLNLAKTNYDREAALLKLDATAKANVDQARATLASTNSNVASLRQQADVQLAKLGGDPNIPVEKHPLYLTAQSKVDEAQRQLDHTIVRAPFDGIVTQVEALQPGAIIVSAMAAFMPTSAVGLVSTDDLWIEANLKETELTYVRPGQSVEIDVDTYPDKTWHGTVDSIAPATGGEFSVLPAQNSSGNWVKVVQRIPVRVKIDKTPDESLLRAGMSVSLKIDTGHRRTLSDLF